MKRILVFLFMIAFIIPCFAVENYFVMNTNDTNTIGDPTRNLTVKYAKPLTLSTKIFFGNGRAIVSVNAPGVVVIQPSDLITWKATRLNSKEVLAITAEALIDAGFNAVEFIGVGTSE